MSKRKTEGKLVKACSRCGGSGYLPAYEHRNGGECFKCLGTGGSREIAAPAKTFTLVEFKAEVAATRDIDLNNLPDDLMALLRSEG